MSLILKQETASSVPTPAVGKGTVFLTDSNQVAVKDTSNVVSTFATVPPTGNTQVFFNDEGALGASSAMVFDKTSSTMTVSNLSVTGTLSAGDISVSSIANGTSNVDIIGASGNVTTSVAGNANIFVVTGTGANVNGTLSVSGNAVINGDLAVNGNVTYINVDNVSIEDPLISVGGGANGDPLTSNDGKDRGVLLQYYSGAPVTGFMGWDTGNGEFAFGSNVTVTSETITYNTLGNIRAGAGIYSNIIANGSVGNGIVGGASTSGSTRGAGVTGQAYVGSSSDAGAATGVRGYATDTHSGGYNIGVLGNASGSGLQNYGFYLQAGNIASIEESAVWDLTDNVTNALAWQSSGKAGILAINTVDGAEGVTMSGTLSVTGNANVGNLSTAGIISATGNITAGNLIGPLASGNSNVSIDANANVSVSIGGTANVFVVGPGAANMTGTFDASGNITGSNLNTGGAVSATGNITGGNLVTSGTLSAASLTTTGNLLVGGNLEVTNNTEFHGNVALFGDYIDTNGANVFTGNIISNAGYIFANGNIQSDSNIIANSRVLIGYASALSGFANPVLLAKTSATDYIQAGIINSTDTGSSDFTAYADNGNDIAGWMDMGFTGSNFSDANYTITGKNDGYIFSKAVSGTGLGGNLVVATGSTGTTNDIVFATGGFDASNEKMRFINDQDQFYIEPTTVSTSTSTGALRVAGGAGIAGNIYGGATLSAAGTATVGNLSTAGTVSASGNANVGNLGTAGLITATGNIGGGNINTAGKISATGNANVGNLGTAGLITATGNVTGGNLVTTGELSATGNITGNNAVIGNVAYVGPGATATSFNNPTIIAKKTGADFIQSALINGTDTGSADFVAYGDNGNDIAGWMDMGFTGSDFSDANYTITGKNDGYIFSKGVAGAGLGGNLVIATGGLSDNNDIVFATGGFLAENEVMRFSDAQQQLQIEPTTVSTSTTTGALVVSGGVGIAGNIYSGGIMSATGNITGGNLTTGGQVSATGNITTSAQYVSTIADGTAPMVVTSSTKVANLNVEMVDGFHASQTADANTIVVRDTSGNINTVVLSASGNISGGNLIAVSAINGATMSATGNITGGNLVTAGQVDAGGGIHLQGAHTGSPTDGLVMDYVHPTARFSAFGSDGFKFYNNGVANVELASISSTGAFVANANITSNNTFVGNTLTSNSSNLTISANGTNKSILLQPTGTGTVDVGNTRITTLAEPSASTDAATKNYVDVTAQGLTVKTACYVATTGTLDAATGGTVSYNNGASGVGANLTTTGTFNLIDGGNVQTAGTRILVKNEANAVWNGIYEYTSTTVITRTADFDNAPGSEIAGAFTFISTGTVNDNTGWVCTNSNPVAVGTDAISFTQFSGAGTYTAGTGLTLTGTQFSISNTAVTAASYGSSTAIPTFTVNQQGQLTAASTAAVVAPAGTLSGTTLNSTVVTSSLTAVGTLASLSVSGNANIGNIGTAGAITATGNITGANFISAGVLSAGGNANVGNLGTAGLITATGNIGGGNIISAGVVSATGNGTFGNVSATAFVGTTLSTSGNANVGNLGTAGLITATGNIGGGNINTAGQLVSSVATGTAPIVVTSTTQVANLNVATAGVAGTVTSAAQPNITSLGTLSSLSVSGNANVGNIGGNNGVFTSVSGSHSGSGAGLSALNGSNITSGTVGAAYVATLNQNTTGYAATVSSAAQPNITSVGTLSSVSVSGNANIGNIGTAGVIVSSIATGTAPFTVTSTTQVANLNVATAGVAGTVSSAAQPNITSVGTLSGLTVSTTINGSVSGSAASATTAGTVTTAAQPNITSTGTLTGMNISGPIVRTTTTGGWLSGNYSGVETAGSTGAIYTIGGSYVPSGSSLSTMYGIGYGYTNTSAANIGGSSGAPNAAWGMYVCSSGISRIFLNSDNGYVYASGGIQTPVVTTGSSGTAGTITGNWTLSAGSKWNATYADLSEKYVADAEYEPGTVLVFGGEQEVTLSTQFDSTRVAGVVTTNPAYTMNSECPGEFVADIALQGRVPVKVVGPVFKGDLLVSAGNGHAIANNEARAGTIIGKSLANFNGESGIIEVAVGRF